MNSIVFLILCVLVIVRSEEKIPITCGSSVKLMVSTYICLYILVVVVVIAVVIIAVVVIVVVFCEYFIVIAN